jgi:hypothetical protein
MKNEDENMCLGELELGRGPQVLRLHWLILSAFRDQGNSLGI